MSELQKFKSFILIYNSTTQNFEVGTNGRAYVFTEGASINQAGTLSGSAGTVLAVFDNGSFVGNSTEYAQIGINGTPRLVTAKTSTSLTLGAGVAQTVAVGDRVLNIGTASDRSASGATIYPVDQTTSTPIIQPVIADANGNFEFYTSTGDYDILIQNSSGTGLYIDADNTLFVFNRSAIGISSQNVVYLLNASDDFMVGGTGITNSDFYVDSTAGKVYIGPPSGSSAYVLAEAAGSLTIAKTSTPTLKYVTTAGTGILQPTSLTGTRTYTLPNASGTLLLASGINQTISSNTTFSGTVTISNTTSLSAALQSSSGAYFATGLVVGDSTTSVDTASLDAKRIYLNKGTTLFIGDITLTSGWGTGATVSSVDTGSNESKMRFTVTPGSAAWSDPQTTTIALPGADWATAPFLMVAITGGASSTYLKTVQVLSCTASVSTITLITGGAAPTAAGNTIAFSIWAVG